VGPNQAAGPNTTTKKARMVRQPHPERRVTTFVALPSAPLMMVVTRDIVSVCDLREPFSSSVPCDRPL
jgi:hypothetical protein